MKGLLNDVCIVYNKTNSNKYGEYTYSSGTTYKCRIMEKTTRYVDDKGVIKTSPLRVFFDGDVSVNVGDKITIDNVNYIVVEVNKSKTGSEVHHTEVKLKNG